MQFYKVIFNNYVYIYYSLDAIECKNIIKKFVYNL